MHFLQRRIHLKWALVIRGLAVSVLSIIIIANYYQNVRDANIIALQSFRRIFLELLSPQHTGKWCLQLFRVTSTSGKKSRKEGRRKEGKKESVHPLRKKKASKCSSLFQNAPHGDIYPLSEYSCTLYFLKSCNSWTCWAEWETNVARSSCCCCWSEKEKAINME